MKDIRQDAGRIAVEQLVHKVLHEAVGFSCAGALYRAYLTQAVGAFTQRVLIGNVGLPKLDLPMAQLRRSLDGRHVGSRLDERRMSPFHRLRGGGRPGRFRSGCRLRRQIIQIVQPELLNDLNLLSGDKGKAIFVKGMLVPRTM